MNGPPAAGGAMLADDWMFNSLTHKAWRYFRPIRNENMLSPGEPRE